MYLNEFEIIEDILEDSELDYKLSKSSYAFELTIDINKSINSDLTKFLDHYYKYTCPTVSIDKCSHPLIKRIEKLTTFKFKYFIMYTQYTLIIIFSK